MSGSKIPQGVWLLGGLASALFCLAAIPPRDFSAAALVCWVPLLIAVERGSVRLALLAGLLQGTTINLLSLSWLAPALKEVAGLGSFTPMMLWFALSVFQGARSALIAVLVRGARNRGWPLAVCFPCALVVCELIYPFLFPWQTALFAHAVPSWFQCAAWGGPLAVTAWLGLCNAGLAHACISLMSLDPVWKRWRQTLLAAGASLAVLVAVTLTGIVSMKRVRGTIKQAPTVRVGVVQGNFLPDSLELVDPTPVYRGLSMELERREHIDLLVWPETAVSSPQAVASLPDFHRDVIAQDRRDVGGEARIRAPLLTGMVLTDTSSRARLPRETWSTAARSAQSDRLRNAAVLFGDTGIVRGIYAKQVLLPVGETELFPRSWARLNQWIPAVTQLLPGEKPIPLYLGARSISVSICYEDMLRSLVRANVRATVPELLVNLTSDSWFGKSAASELHLALAKFRAVEHRRYLVRATNTGISAVVDPTGVVAWRLPPHVRTYGIAEARWLREPTVYERVGDLPAAAVGMLSIVMLFVQTRLSKPI